MAITAGDIITDTISHIIGGVPYPGATFTVVTARKPDGTSFTPTITDIGAGTYTVSFQTGSNEAGSWYLLVVDSAQDPDVFYEETYNVDVARTTTGTSRRDLRRWVGRTVGDLLQLKATAAGSPTTITDVLRLGTADNSLIGRLGWVSEGTPANLYQMVRLLANSHTSATATFTPALPTDTAIGDVIEFYNERETSAGPDEFNEHINGAIRSVGIGTRVDVESSILAWTSDSTTGLAIPVEWDGYLGVVYKDWTGRWLPVPWADRELDLVNRTVFLTNRSQWLASGLDVKLLGTTEADILTSDTDTTSINAEYLMLQASASILQATAYRRMNSVEARQDAQTFQARANALRPRARRRARANWIRL